MSVKVMSAVWDQSQHAGNNLITLLALADNANDAGYCWPGLETLAKKVRVSRSTVMRCITRLEETAEIYADHNRRHGNRYLVLVGQSDDAIQDSLRTYFKLTADKVQTAYEEIVNLRVMCQNDTNSSKSQIDTSEVPLVTHQKSHSYATSEVPPVTHDPSINHQPIIKEPIGEDGSTKLERDALFDAIALHVFNAKKGTPTYSAAIKRAVKLGWWCLGRDMVEGPKSDPTVIPGCQLPVTANHIGQWAKAWKSSGNAALPRTGAKFVEHFFPWLEQQQHAHTVPPIAAPTDDELAENLRQLGIAS